MSDDKIVLCNGDEIPCINSKEFSSFCVILDKVNKELDRNFWGKIGLSNPMKTKELLSSLGININTMSALNKFHFGLVKKNIDYKKLYKVYKEDNL